MILGERFLLPELLPLLLAPVALRLLQAGLEAAHGRRLARMLGARAPVLTAERSSAQCTGRRNLQAAALVLAIVAMAQPLGAPRPATMEQRGIDVVICLDLSRSMLARDAGPASRAGSASLTRLARAQEEIRSLAEAAGGDRLALVSFAGEARLSVPLTHDTSSFAQLAGAVDPLTVERGGTDLGAALEAALAVLDGAAGRPGAIVLVSDGEDLERRGLAVARTCRERSVPVHCVGIGSDRGSKIALAGEGGGSFLRDRDGAEVVSFLDPAGMQRIAGVSGGSFVDATRAPGSLRRLYVERLLPWEGEALEQRGRLRRANLFQPVLLAALLLWMNGWALTGRRRR